MKQTQRRVLFVDQTAQLGGAELWLKDVVLARQAIDKVFLFQTGPLAELLAGRGTEVVTHVLSARMAGLRKDSGLWVKLASGLELLGIARNVARAASDVDVIYANTPKALVVSALAGKLARKPVIYHLHDILSREHFSRSNMALLVGCSNYLIKHVVANSTATEQAYSTAGGRCSCSISYNGFDPRAFKPFIQQRDEHRQSVRRELRIADETPLVAVFGRLAPWKGQQLAIEAIGQLSGVHLMLVGDALFGEQDYKRQLQALADQPQLAGRVHFTGFRREVLPLMQAADLVVHCSIAPEPFGRVIVEAMLSKRPIIAARAGGAAEIITDGEDGFLFTPGDSASLAQCIDRVLKIEPTDRDSMLERAHSSASKRFSLTAAVDHLEQTIQEITD